MKIFQKKSEIQFEFIHCVRMHQRAGMHMLRE